jgi:hypothetical protein
MEECSFFEEKSGPTAKPKKRLNATRGAWPSTTPHGVMPAKAGILDF